VNAATPILASILVLSGVSLTRAATLQVNNTADAVDAVPGNGTCATATPVRCTLRAAVMEANALAGTDTIVVPAGTYVFALAGTGEDGSATGDLDLADDVIVNGAGAATTVIDAADLDRVIHVLPWVEAQISGVTLRNGMTVPMGGVHPGAGLFNEFAGMVKLDRCVVASNAAFLGAGIMNRGTLEVVDSTIENNSAEELGGAVYNFDDSTANLERTTVSGNFSGDCGTIYNNGYLELVNSTVSGNDATLSGGALLNNEEATASLTNVTITNNEAGLGAGIRSRSGGSVELVNTIVAVNLVGDDCAVSGASLTSLGHNLDGDDTCDLVDATDLPMTDPKLGALASNGGPTRTHALLAGSPAIDAGDDTACPATDQRGISRPQNGDGVGGAQCDIGAFERQPGGGGGGGGGSAAACGLGFEVALLLPGFLAVRARRRLGRWRARP
jgi:CSLREA domain-containing protein